MDVSNTMEIGFNIETGFSQELLIVLMKFLKKYLMDDTVKIVDMASQTLRVILYGVHQILIGIIADVN